MVRLNSNTVLSQDYIEIQPSSRILQIFRDSINYNKNIMFFHNRTYIRTHSNNTKQKWPVEHIRGINSTFSIKIWLNECNSNKSYNNTKSSLQCFRATSATRIVTLSATITNSSDYWENFKRTRQCNFECNWNISCILIFTIPTCNDRKCCTQIVAPRMHFSSLQ